jgi:hypothetical protein
LFTASNGVVGAAPDFVVGAEPGERMADGTGRAIQIAAVFADVDGTLITKDKVLTHARSRTSPDAPAACRT